MKLFWPSLRLFLLLSLLTGLAYPLAMTGLAQWLFPAQAGGSLVLRGGRAAGSALLAQPFGAPDYFWPRPSGHGFSTLPSGGANLGPTSRKLRAALAANSLRALAAHGSRTPLIPGDLLFHCASGLDPHISPQAAMFQFERVATARQLSPGQRGQLRGLILRLTEGLQWGLMGNPRVNVVVLNMELDKLAAESPQGAGQP